MLGDGGRVCTIATYVNYLAIDRVGKSAVLSTPMSILPMPFTIPSHPIGEIGGGGLVWFGWTIFNE